MKKSSVFLAFLAGVMAASGILFGAPRSVVLFDGVVIVGASFYVLWQVGRSR